MNNEHPELESDNVEELILLPGEGLESHYGEDYYFLNQLHEMLEKDGIRRFQMDSDFKIGTEGWLQPADSPDDGQVQLLGSAFASGPKLVRVTAEIRRSIRASGVVRLVPNCKYRTVSTHPGPTPIPLSGSRTTLEMKVLDVATGRPVPGARVTLFEEVLHAIGDTGVSDNSGQLSLRVSKVPLKVERLFVEPPRTGYWGRYLENFVINSPAYQIQLDPVATTHVDAARRAYQPALTSGAGVRVAVVDHGIDAEAVPVVAGKNLVRGEPEEEYGDDGTGHGTHVAGVIANSQSGALAGIAPAAEIFSYRVFGAQSEEATSFEVLMAVVAAVQNGCHLVNLSLGGLAYDTNLRDLDVWAADRGAILIAAAGNDWGGNVTLPAALPNTLAVAAVGRIGTFPADSLERSLVGLRSKRDPDDFFAAFSNYQPEGAVDLVAPGVGILSVQPGGGYGPLSGTSQACAVATAAAARALTGTQWLTDPADRQRTTNMKNYLLSRAVPIGLSLAHEGAGRMP
ncbi:S8 family serine peptidase [Streptomyces sp. NPDC001530]|uniref:S8 family peptidase n=1 Tax=Streptomyces sp. NPDC001530 TaxID=3364582 RepID=UPI003694C4A7